jgi:hypothetical protein
MTSTYRFPLIQIGLGLALIDCTERAMATLNQCGVSSAVPHCVEPKTLSKFNATPKFSLMVRVCLGSRSRRKHRVLVRWRCDD